MFKEFALNSLLGQAGILIISILVTATLSIYGLKKFYPSIDLKEVAARTKSWWLMATFFFLAVAIHPKVTILFFAFMSFWALKEYVTILNTRRADHRALVWAFLTIPIQYYWIATSWYIMCLLFVPLYAFLFIPVRLVLVQETQGFLTSTAKIQWGLLAFVFGLSHMALLSTMPVLAGTKVNGQSLLLFLVIVTEMNDVFQFIFGKLFGRTKILPLVSPNKTSEGFWGGILTTACLSVFVKFLTPFNVVETIFFAFCIAVLGFFGDVVMAAVKRDAGIKDFSSIIPGHGGVLDRVNSLCYTAPVFFHLMSYFYY